MLRKLPASVAIVVDTSASQVGDYRNDELKALEGILAGLRPSDEVQLFAADVSTTALSKRFLASDKQAVTQAVATLRRRLPLGNTNLTVALDTARQSLKTQAHSVTKSVIYVGDGASLETAGNEQKIKTLVDSLRADQVSCSQRGDWTIKEH